MKLILTFSMLLFSLSSSANGGLGTITGKESTTFSDDRTSVIVAKVLDVKLLHDSKSPDLFSIELQSIATLAGKFDASSTDKIILRGHVGTPGTSVGKPLPPAGAFVIAVVYIDVLNGFEETPTNWVASDLCDFMTNRSAMTIITGLDDPQVETVITALRKARHDSTTQPATTTPTSPAKEP